MMGSDNESVPEPMDISDLNTDGTPAVQELHTDPMADHPMQDAEQESAISSLIRRGQYTWEINVKELERGPERRFSEVFECGGYYWQLLVCPNARHHHNFISAYLCVPDYEGAQAGIRRTQFELVLENKDPENSVRRTASQNFDVRGGDWGFTQFVGHEDVYSQSKGFQQNGTVLLRVEIQVESPDSYLEAEKKRTGYVGLKNQGATCYMNSLLQTLYNINIFRQAVYQMPIKEDEQAENSIPLALQSLFFKLQFGKHIVNTKSLTQSFGWTSMDAFTQHDVQELNRILSDRLEKKMKGTVVEGTIGRLFEGRIHNFVKCINVDYTSTREEVFADLQLLVKDCKTMYDSFDKSIEVEVLDGQNQYQAEGFGLQDAKKGVLFDSFPPVLQIQLKRFDYDFNQDQMVKINSRYEFPEELDLDRDNYKYLSKNADRSIRNKYKLHSVLVHSGGIHGGHYYAFINPSGKQWIRFDDERVTLAERHQAMDEQFGVEEAGGNYLRNSKFSNAYMLVYIRENDWPHVMCEVGKDNLSRHVRDRLDREIQEKEDNQREKTESHLYTEIRIVRDEDMQKYIADGNHFDLVDVSKVEKVKVKKFSRFKEFRELMAKQLGVPAEKQLWWGWAKRLNGSYRPKTFYGKEQDEQFVCNLKDADGEKVYKQWTTQLNLYYSVGGDAIRDALSKCNWNEETPKIVTIFWKLYLPRESRLEYVSSTLVSNSTKLKQIIYLLASKANSKVEKDWDDYTIWEEVKSIDELMVTKVDQDNTCSQEQISTGDILIIQENLSEEEAATVSYPTVESYLQYVRNRSIVTFKRIDEPQEEGFKLELSKAMTYSEVEESVAEELDRQGVLLPDSSHLRFTAQQVYAQVPKPHPLSYNGAESLEQMLSARFTASPHPDTLYYEVLDLPLPEFEKLKVLKVSWHNVKGEQVREHKLRVNMESSISDLMRTLCENEPEAASAKRLRLLEGNDTKIYKVHDQETSEPVDRLSDDSFCILRAEAVPEEDLAIEEGMDINCVHVSLNSGVRVMPFGNPLIVRVSAKETMESLAARIQRRLEVKDEDFSKWQFRQLKGIMTSDPDLIDPEDIVSERFSAAVLSNGTMPIEYLGLQHAVTHAKRAPARSGPSNGYGIKIQ